MPFPDPAALLANVRTRNPSGPLLTHYDDATDERVELSATTLDNWVAKTANLLQDEFDVGPGSTVAVALPVHWQTAAVLLAVWSCGATVLDTAAEDEGGLAGADLVVAAQARLPAAGGGRGGGRAGQAGGRGGGTGRRRAARLVPAPAGHGDDRLHGPGASLRAG